MIYNLNSLEDYKIMFDDIFEEGYQVVVVGDYITLLEAVNNKSVKEGIKMIFGTNSEVAIFDNWYINVDDKIKVESILSNRIGIIVYPEKDLDMHQNFFYQTTK